MLRIRDDDVLVRSSSWNNSFTHFKEIHEYIAGTEGKVMHVPAVLVSEIQEFPECIAYMKEQTALGTMEPEIHGYKHIDYSRLALPLDKVPPRGRIKLENYSDDELSVQAQEVIRHLSSCVQWITTEFGRAPTKWYTPWGADNKLLRDCAKIVGVELIGTENLFEIAAALEMLRNGASLEDIEKRGEVMIHWWQRGSRVKRFCAVARHGSWAEAVKREPAIFEE